MENADRFRKVVADVVSFWEPDHVKEAGSQTSLTYTKGASETLVVRLKQAGNDRIEYMVMLKDKRYPECICIESRTVLLADFIATQAIELEFLRDNTTLRVIYERTPGIGREYHGYGFLETRQAYFLKRLEMALSKEEFFNVLSEYIVLTRSTLESIESIRKNIIAIGKKKRIKGDDIMNTYIRILHNIEAMEKIG